MSQEEFAERVRQLVGEAEDAARAKELVAELSPQMVCLDLKLSTSSDTAGSNFVSTADRVTSRVTVGAFGVFIGGFILSALAFSSLRSRSVRRRAAVLWAFRERM